MTYGMLIGLGVISMVAAFAFFVALLETMD
jgi:hypothetical protein